ncbi:uncharacterized protein LOC133714520 [Rosa rugosa]|uniref:uncharacterized protein LOC133714520 n=1 Tax=Rosa rugosa TaxID=74645 RepID=UPI002B4009BC|nr:uncharacterized protein LOC133714520 [Rosa rugosa]
MLVVADLIDGDIMTWATDFMRELFTEGEVERMASIPLSIRGVEDCLVWHYDKKGFYQVRSGYHVYNTAMSNKDCASTSSGEDGGVSSKYWSKVWGAQIHPKAKSFVWRLLKNILPTKAALLQRRVALVNHNCMFCMGATETGTHLFKSCHALHCFWLFGPLRLHVSAHPAKSVRDWVLDMIDLLEVDQQDFFFMGLWAIWAERKNMVWKGANFQSMNMLHWTTKMLDDFQKYHQKPVKKQKRPLTKWKNPPSGRLKINVDGAFRPEDGNGGIGVVVRNDAGMGIAVLARPFLLAHSVLNMEAEACSLLLGIHQGWADIDVESDSAILIAALNRGRRISQR